MSGSYIVAGARTPIGKMSGALASFSAADLGGFAIKAALERAGVSPEEVEHVIMGQVLMAGQGQVPSRQAAVKAGIPMSVPSVNINKVCLSGLNSIYLANQMIMAGEADIVVAGGMESMTNAPYLAAGRPRRLPLRQHRARRRDHQGRPVVRVRRLPHGPRHRALRRRRHHPRPAGRHGDEEQRARRRRHQADGRLADEIVPVSIPQRKGDPILVETDEGVRPDTTMESLAGLKPAFDKEGTITAANASQISDGGSAVVLMSEKAVNARGVTPLGQFVSYGMVAGPDSASLLHQPSRAIQARSPGPARPSPTSTCSRSTRRSPPSASPRWPTSASATRSSTSTAAPSPSATRSA